MIIRVLVADDHPVYRGGVRSALADVDEIEIIVKRSTAIKRSHPRPSYSQMSSLPTERRRSYERASPASAIQRLPTITRSAERNSE